MLRWKAVWIVTLTVVASLWQWSSPATAAPADSYLSGSVKSASGDAMGGVAVSARAAGSTITTSVYTDDQGAYYFPPLPSGHYEEWAQAVGYEASRTQLDLKVDQTARQSFTLNTLKDFSRQLTTPEWLAALPADTLEDRRMKTVFSHNCDSCHPAAFALQNRFDRDGWLAILKLMARIGVYGNPPQADTVGEQTPYVEHFRDELADYLARVRGPESAPLNFKPRPRPRGEAAQVVVTEYEFTSDETLDQSVVNNGSIWSDGIPSAYDARAAHDADVDPQGMVWIVEAQPNPLRTVMRLNPNTGEVTNFMIPSEQYKGLAMISHGVMVDRTGIVWFNADGGLGRIDSKETNPKIQRFMPPQGMARVGTSFCADPQGNIWSAAPITPGKVDDGGLRFDVATYEFSEFHHPVPGGRTYAIGCDAEGNGWWSQMGGRHFDVMGKADMATGKTVEVPLTSVPYKKEIMKSEDLDFYAMKGSSVNNAPPWAQGPRRMSGDRVGNMWVADWWGNDIVKIDSKANKVLKYYPYPNPEHVSIFTTAADRNGMVWASLMNSDAVGKFNPKTEKWTEYQLPSRGDETRDVAVDNTKDPVEVWLPSFRTNKMLRLQFRTAQQMRDAKTASLAQK